MSEISRSVPSEFLEIARSLRKLHPEPAHSYRFPLAHNSLEEGEIAAILEAIVRGPLTQGPRVAAFEREFAEAHGAAGAVFCNSGSSANLLILSALARPRDAKRARLHPGDEVIVPAVTWSTTVWPVIQVGCVPVLADVSPETLNLTVESVARALSPRTRAVLVAHTLGNPAPVEALADLCARRDLMLLEDACESLDATIGSRKVGTFGRLSSFSFYFSHHITTIEGGMILCGNAEDADWLRVLRAHGWARELPAATQSALEKQYPDLDPRFLFVGLGYNLRGTDLHAAIGRVQFSRREKFLARRRQIAAIWGAAREANRDLFAPIRFERGASHFAFPLVLREGTPATRQQLIEFLESHGIENRPLIAGNLARQPALAAAPHRVAGSLEGADMLHHRGLYIGLHPGLTESGTAQVAEVLASFAREDRR